MEIKIHKTTELNPKEENIKNKLSEEREFRATTLDLIHRESNTRLVKYEEACKRLGHHFTVVLGDVICHVCGVDAGIFCEQAPDHLCNFRFKPDPHDETELDYEHGPFCVYCEKDLTKHRDLQIIERNKNV